MLDIELLRKNPEVVKESILKRGDKPDLVDNFLKIDREWRDIVLETDELLQTRNKYSKEEALSKKDELSVIKTKIESLKEKELNLGKLRDEIYLKIPNLVAEDVPVGPGESANTPVKKIGENLLQSGLTHEELFKKADLIEYLKTKEL